MFQVLVLCGLNKNQASPIKRRVLRIGSSPNNDICIPGTVVPSHWTTIESRIEGPGKGVVIYNRSSHAIHVGTRSLPPAAATKWSVGESVFLDGKAIVQLENQIDKSERVTREENGQAVDSLTVRPIDKGGQKLTSEAANQNSGSRKRDVSKIVQCFVLALTGIVCFLGFAMRSSSHPNESIEPIAFELIMKAGSQLDLPGQLVEDLRFAELNNMRKDVELALLVYTKIEKKLAVRLDKPIQPEKQAEVERTIMRFVHKRQAKLVNLVRQSQD